MVVGGGGGGSQCHGGATVECPITAAIADAGRSEFFLEEARPKTSPVAAVVAYKDAQGAMQRTRKLMSRTLA
jgi:hypothetical protein